MSNSYDDDDHVDGLSVADRRRMMRNSDDDSREESEQRRRQAEPDGESGTDNEAPENQHPSDIFFDAFENQKAISRNYPQKPFQAILGPVGAAFLQTIIYMDNRPGTFKRRERCNGKTWLAKNQKELSEWLVIPKKQLFAFGGAVDRLLGLRLIQQALPKASGLDATLWRYDEDRTALFLLATYQLYSSKDEDAWRKWAMAVCIDKTFRICGSGGGFVCVFPGLDNSTTTFKNKTPFKMHTGDKETWEALHKSFKNMPEKKLAKICYGANWEDEKRIPRIM